jgi:glycosyltransferase involved in cell wall biosynthesis
MRILHLISSSGMYGAEQVLLSLARLSKKDGHRPYVVCLKAEEKSDPDLYAKAKVNAIDTLVIGCRRKLDIGAVLKIKRFIIDNRIDIVHSHGYKANFYGACVCRLIKVPIVATLHGWTAENRKIKLYENIDKLIMRSFDHLVPVSPLIYDYLRKKDFSTRKITFIPNAVDTEKFSPEARSADIRQKFGLGHSLVIGSVGRLSPEKGHSRLIRVFKQIVSVYPDAKLLIVGDGALRESLEEEARSLGLRDKVIFAGSQADMVSMYKAMDIFVLPSFTEGLSLVMLEAMSMGLAVVATAVGAASFVAGDGECILIPPHDNWALEKALLALINDSQLRVRMKDKARQRVSADFSLASFSRNYMRIYRNFLPRSHENN